jgi:gamma-glutamyltranspeptidase/glutathione hydrolase
MFRSLALAAAALVLPVVAHAAHQPVRARNGMVVSRDAYATDAGVKVLRSGGNAIDAAIATGLALAVTHPAAGNIGGGGFMLIRFADGRTTFIDFREQAPESASRGMYLGPDGKPTNDSLIGWRASGVPGTVRGFELASKKYGKMPWANVVSPAVALARDGFPVSWDLARSLRNTTDLARFPESKRIFLHGGKYYEPGENLMQPDLAATLERIARDGAREFYEGETARRLAAAMRENGGSIALSDLKRYEAVERKPITGRYRNFDIISAPPPSSGGVGVLQMLGVLEGTGYEKHGAGSAASIHWVAEAMRRYFADRSEYLGDPDFFRVPVAGLIDKQYVAGLRRSIDPERASPSDRLRPGNPSAFVRPSQLVNLSADAYVASPTR